MIATITITRRDQRDEDRSFLVDVTRDRDGDIWATCGENVDELRTTNRHGSIETHPTGRLFQRRGEPIELEDDELEEAEAALSQLEALWQAERAKLKEIFAPVSEAPAHGDAPMLGFSFTEYCPMSVCQAAEDDLDASSKLTPSPPRHDLLNSQGVDIALPPGVGAEVSEPGKRVVEGPSNQPAVHE